MNNRTETAVIKKIRKEKEFAQISNKLINNRELSYKALGILTYILSKPDDWEVYMSDLMREGVDGEKSVRSGLKELINHKYIQRYRVYNKETGKVNHWETLVSEEPFKDDELISSVKEKYLLNENGEIINRKIKLGDFVRFTPIVVEREVFLLSQNSKIEKNNNDFSTLPKPTSRKPINTKRRTTNTNNTNTDKTNTEFSSSSKGDCVSNSNQQLIEMFNESICKLKKTTTVKFMDYIKKYDHNFIKHIITYCEERGAKSFSYFEKTIEEYIKNGVTTVDGFNNSIDEFKNKNKTKKNSALRDKEDISRSRSLEDTINDKIMEGLISNHDSVVEFEGKLVDDVIKPFLKEYVGDIAYSVWIDNLDIRYNKENLLIACKDELTKDIVESRYYGEIAKAMTLGGLNGGIKFVLLD